MVAAEHPGVFAEEVQVDFSDREDGDPDHGTGFDANIWLHCCFRREESRGYRELKPEKGGGAVDSSVCGLSLQYLDRLR